MCHLRPAEGPQGSYTENHPWASMEEVTWGPAVPCPSLPFLPLLRSLRHLTPGLHRFSEPEKNDFVHMIHLRCCTSWTARKSNQSILKETSPGCSLKGLMLKLKLQYFGHLMRKSWLIWKDPDSGKDGGQEDKWATEDEMVGWYHWLNGQGFGWTPGVGDGQGGLVCCSSWGRKESDTTERLNWTERAQHCKSTILQYFFFK